MQESVQKMFKELRCLGKSPGNTFTIILDQISHKEIFFHYFFDYAKIIKFIQNTEICLPQTYGSLTDSDFLLSGRNKIYFYQIEKIFYVINLKSKPTKISKEVKFQISMSISQKYFIGNSLNIYVIEIFLN